MVIVSRFITDYIPQDMPDPLSCSEAQPPGLFLLFTLAQDTIGLIC